MAGKRSDAPATAGVKYGSRRSGLKFGVCNVTIPLGHHIGALESPSIWRLEFSEDVERHVVLVSTARTTKAEFFTNVAARIHASQPSAAFVFIHGYNVTFEDAARRTAQMAYDLNFDGAPVFFSWPSRGTTAAYTIDEQNIEWAQAHIKDLLDEFLLHSDAQRVYLIAHSMGNRGLTRALASLLVEKPALRERITEIILTAPDIDAEVFKQDLAPKLAAGGRPVTLYASSGDVALAASKKVHGYPRAGDSGAGLVVTPGVETIDATEVDTGLLGHSYFADTRSVLTDLFELMQRGARPDTRFGLRPIEAPTGRYWEFKR